MVPHALASPGCEDPTPVMTDPRPHVIGSFDGEYSYLASSAPVPTPFRGTVFSTSEHAFAAARAAHPDDVVHIASVESADDATAFGETIEAVEEWDVDRYQAMEVIVAAKFAHNADLGVALAATMGSVLVNGNTAHDQIWGTCVCPEHIDVDGDNALGVILMSVRMRLAAELAAPDPLETENP